ncbi:protein of unknown function [Methylocaldum szegediense]|uniref:Uncharacterized protein n=1 Tax=Methylocaldum szegediense TaxID=73780 RepID=A0ABN8X885_9GAMM|nr:protein of unknown function [Methylocaldum szegediense]
MEKADSRYFIRVKPFVSLSRRRYHFAPQSLHKFRLTTPSHKLSKLCHGFSVSFATDSKS